MLRFNAPTGERLLNAYRHNPVLIELGLSADEVGAACWEEVMNVYNSKRALVSADDIMEDSYINEESGKMIEAYM